MSYSNGQFDEELSSKFNAGVLRTYSISRLLDLINDCWIHATDFNFVFNDWNYNVIFSGLGVIKRAIGSFVKSKDRDFEDLEMQEKVLEAIFEKYPPRDIRTPHRPNHKESVLIKGNWKIIKKYLQIFAARVEKVGTAKGVISKFDEGYDEDEI